MRKLLPLLALAALVLLSVLAHRPPALHDPNSPDAYEKLVDRLLASPHYGEKWGRHWLDVARYVQGRITFPGVKHTDGDQHYRDYVVSAFNTDKPYDQFLTEQLAGDLLPPSHD